MPAVPPVDLPYRQFQFPLNVFMHVLTLEEGGVTYLHYGLFDRPGEPIAMAQERSTELLLSRLPPPPARVLDVGVGVGTTLARLARLGYDATGITPDEQQAAIVRATYGPDVNVFQVAFENVFPRAFDAVVFQESSQYIDAMKLFAKAREITKNVVVLDEFSTDATATLHRLDDFLRAAAAFRFAKTEEVDLSQRAAPTVDYFLERLPRYRDVLERDLGLSAAGIDELIESGTRYRDLYRRGAYVYRLLRFERTR
jgi:SAM-dependent methyltransferase